MSRGERLVNYDPRFASLIDIYCTTCSHLGFRDNDPQLQNLQERSLAYPDESRLIKVLADWCQNTCPKLKSETGTISIQYSCLWRREWDDNT